MVCSSYEKGYGHSFTLHPKIHVSLSTFLVMSFAVQLVSLRVLTLCIETATWSQGNSPTCDLCDTDDIQDEQHVIFHCINPHVISLRRKYASLFPPTGAHGVFTFLSQNNNKLYFFLHELIAFYEQAGSRTS